MAKDKNPQQAQQAAATAVADAPTGETPEQIKARKKAEKAERKKNRPVYPRPDGGLQTVGSDYSPTKFQKLTAKDFAAEHFYLTFMADIFEKRAKRYRAQAGDSKLLGDSKHAAKAKKLLKMQREFSELKAQLAAEDGLDIDAILRSLSGQEAAPAQG